MHVNGNHWVVLHLNFEEKSFTWYDSLGNEMMNIDNVINIFDSNKGDRKVYFLNWSKLTKWVLSLLTIEFNRQSSKERG